MKFSFLPTDVNHPGEDKQTALHFAAKYKSAKAIKKSNTNDSNITGEEGAGDENGEAPKPVIQVRYWAI